jgi:hypothetical protein
VTTEFLIQASNPRSLGISEPEDETLAEAIETVFPMEAEYAFLVWKGVYIPLSYKYDLSFLVDDVIVVLEEMLANARGSRVVAWPSNTFASVWNITWDEDVTVNAQWDCVLGAVAPLLASRPTITVPKAEFIAEWKRPLLVIERALRSSGYDVEQLPALARLGAVIDKLPGEGRLYSESQTS